MNSMEQETIQELGEIIDFLSNRTDNLMPLLKKEFEETKAWPMMQVGGAYLLFTRECSMTGEMDPVVKHQYALSRILAMPQLQEAMSMAMASGLHNRATGGDF